MSGSTAIRVVSLLVAAGGATAAVAGQLVVGASASLVAGAVFLFSYASTGSSVSAGGPAAGTEEAPEAAPLREPLSGVVEVAGREWTVEEQKRSGPGSQLLILTEVADPASVMHVRPRPGDEATTLREVELHATAPSCRWFQDLDGRRWEARLVVYAEENNREVELVKFISDADVVEGRYRMMGGIGLRSVAELRQMLASLRSPSSDA